MSNVEGAHGFELGDQFSPGELSGGLGLGPLEMQYEDLFAEVLEDGVITQDERARLEKAADNLGLDRSRLLRLEQAMVEAYQQRHRVRIVEHFEEPLPSLEPIDVRAAGDAGREMLLTQIEQLRARVKELEAELRRVQAQVNVEVDLTDLEITAADASEDPEAVWRRIRRDPTQADAVRALYRIYRARGELDKQWCVSQALVVLGVANEEERASYEKYRTTNLIAARASVSQRAWQEYLFHPEQEPLTGQIFALVAPAALIGRVSALRRQGQLHQPPPETLQDPSKATVTAVRAIPWAAALLGLAPPPVYLEKERDAGYEHIPAVPPVTVIGRQVLSGLSQTQHAFRIGRHISYYRQENFVKTLFSSVPDLEDLFLAALTVGNPGLPIAQDMKQRVGPVAKAIEAMLDANQTDALRACFLRFVEEGGRTNLQRWSQAVDKTACRAGLLLCNDALVACDTLTGEERGFGELSKDLIAFTTSERYFALRHELGIAIGSN